jgi:hypothetical protein
VNPAACCWMPNRCLAQRRIEEKPLLRNVSLLCREQCMVDNISETRIYLELDEELKEILDDNRLNIMDILQNEKIEADVILGTPPFLIEENFRKKEPITLILAGGAAIVSIALAISKVLGTFYNRPQIIKFYELVELRDASDNVLRDAEGNPIFKKRERYKILQPKVQEMQEIKVDFDIKNGIFVQISSKFDSKSQ